MADALGLNDYSLLNGSQQTTARQIQDAFTASQGAYGRQLERYTIPTSGPMVAQNFEDSALRRAQVTAGILNNNQNLQDIIDAANHTPHGVSQNLAAYLPYLGAGNALVSTLFGRQAGGALSEGGLVGAGRNLWNTITHPGSGTSYSVDPTTGQVTYGTGATATTGGGSEAGWPGDTSWDPTATSSFTPDPWPDVSGASFPTGAEAGVDFGSDLGF